MIELDRRTQWIAAALAALAGFVDAVGVLGTGGFFLSFMSGNSTRLGVGLAEAAPYLLIPLAIIAAFVSGVFLGSLLGRRAGRRRGRLVLLMVGCMLGVAGAVALAGAPWLGIALAAAAMGAENTAFEADGKVRFGLTYMTGTLVRLGQGAAAAFAGEDRSGWQPWFRHWVALMVGAVAGALLYPLTGLAALLVAAAFAVALSFVITTPASQG